MKTLARQILCYGDPDVIELESIQQPSPGAGEVLLKVMATGVGPWDAVVRAGQRVVCDSERMDWSRR